MDVAHGIAPPDETGTVAVGDRRLGWAAWGPPTGTPVLFCSGAAMGCGLGFGADVVARLGIRLVALDRPGLGRSDPQPGRTLLDWADDVRAAVAALGLVRPGIVGFSQGAPFALAAAAGGVVGAAAVVSGQDELAHPAVQELLAEPVAALVRAIAADPDAVEAELAHSAEAEGMWHLVVDTSSPEDRRLYTSGPFAAAYRRSLVDGFAQGAAGYARDTVLALSRWPFDLSAVTVPVDLWFGRHDASPVHSPDAGATLAGRIPGARRHVLADAGGGLLWTHAEAILQALLARLDQGR